MSQANDKKVTLKQVEKAIEKHMYSCCTYASQAELLRDRVLSDLRRVKDE
jgi:hypothetical protein